MIDGFQSIWSKPYCINGGANEYFMQDYEILTMMLSALMWRRHNGGMKLFADAAAAEYIEKLGIAHIWNLGMEEIRVSDRIPVQVFWAAGKLYALRQMQMPAVMVDLDLIIWQDIQNVLSGTDICCIHREGLFPDVYPPKEFFHMQQDYQFDPAWDWNAFPVNTCMLYLADAGFRDYYTGCAIEFMEHCRETRENLCHMVFAEQRLIAMCADRMGRQISSFFPGSTDIGRQDIFTHLWGYKNILRFNYEDRVAFNRKICTRIRADFPEETDTLMRLHIAGWPDS